MVSVVYVMIKQSQDLKENVGVFYNHDNVHNFYKKYKKEIDRFIDQALIEDIENLDHRSKVVWMMI